MVVEDCGSAGVEGFEKARELAVEDVMRSVVVTLHVAGRHVLEKVLVSMTTFELGLPDVVMGVDEAG